MGMAARMGDQVLQDSPHCHAPIHPAAPTPTAVLVKDCRDAATVTSVAKQTLSARMRANVSAGQQSHRGARARLSTCTLIEGIFFSGTRNAGKKRPQLTGVVR